MVENTISSQLKSLRKNKGWTQAQLADKLSVSKQTISNWETGLKTPRMGSLQNLADLFHVKIGEITNASIAKKKTDSKLPTNIIFPLISDQFEHISIPLIGKLNHKDSITAKENIEGYVEEIFEKPVPTGTLFALCCKGKSMEPTIHDGSIVTIREQSSAKDNEIAAILIDGENKITLKRIKHQGSLIILMSDNNEFDPIILDKDTPGQIVGKAVHVSWNIK
ncbi:LexA family protein [Limosilactobacillus sp.]|uniref:LexA family protein n=1 Tax=Limosilactobacillus sp. TaxID=2773925 RepID=UPI003EFC21F6